MRATVPFWSLLVPIVGLVTLLWIAGQQPDGRLHVWVLDVGQGDAVVVRTPLGHTALIDGGPGATPVLNGVGTHMPSWQHDIDLLVLTTPNESHMMGLPDLLSRYQIDQIVQPHFTATSGVQTEWLRMIEERAIPVHIAAQGDNISFDGEPDVVLQVLSNGSSQPSRGTDAKDASLTVRLTCGKHSVLLEGDTQEQSESERVSRQYEQWTSDILRIGSNGGRKTLSRAFLDNVRPKVAIISVGAGNRLGLPAPQTVEALEAAGSMVYRTDQNGTVEIIADSEHLWVRSER